MATSINFPTSPASGDTYVYSATTYIWDTVRWHPEFLSLSALTDTNITSGNTTDTDALTWDSATSRWIPGAVGIPADSVGYAELKDELKSTGDTTFISGTTYGEQLYLSAGTYTFTATTDSISVLCIGGGGGGRGVASNENEGGGGGGLGYKNDIAVVNGNTYTVVVGSGGTKGDFSNAADSGGTSYFSATTLVAGFGGSGGINLGAGVNGVSGGTYTGDGGGNGGNALGATTSECGGGGGAGGYSGDGGIGGNGGTNGTAGSGGGGGGGGGGGSSDTGSGGGGTGLYGEGASGIGGIGQTFGDATTGGGGGSGGEDGVNFVITFPADGGAYGGGGAGSDNTNNEMGDGGVGAVRIIWGTGVSFPASGTTSGVTTSLISVDWNDGVQFNYTLTASTEFEFLNYVMGKSITLAIDGSYSFTFPPEIAAGDLLGYNGSKINYIQIYCADDDGAGVFVTTLKNY
jgi:hypothetical protein